MARVCLKLKNDDGSFREYRKDRITARWVKEAMKHSKKLDEIGKKNDPVMMLDERLKFTCGVFGDKELTPEAILDGLEVDELFPALDGIYNVLMGHGEEEPQGK